MLRKAFYILVSLLVLFLLSKALIRALPGDPLDSLLAETGLTIPREKIREDLGLNLSFFESLRRDFIRLLQGDLGYSLITREPVLPLLLERLKRTLILSFGALSLALTLALPVGLFCASQKETRSSRFLRNALNFFCTVSIVIPIVWMGPLILYAFSIFFPWTEFHGSFVLASIGLAIPFAGSWARMIELRTREEITQPFYQVALAKGLPFWKTILKHGVSPAAGSLLAVLGSQFGGLLAGSALAETIFDWPGLGSVWVQAILQRDYPIMQGATLLSATLCLGGILIGDGLQKIWDPRQREGSS